jgi:hypothetical protein
VGNGHEVHGIMRGALAAFYSRLGLGLLLPRAYNYWQDSSRGSHIYT